MRLTTIEAVVRALNDAGVRYLVAGGVAVNAHGHQRMTQDLDLVLSLTRDNTLNALMALADLAYGPVLPVPAEQFADPEKRREWIERRKMQVFSLTSDRHREMAVDLFVFEPFDFDREYTEAMVAEIAPGLTAPFVRLPTLIAMKDATGRAQDQDDATRLGWILEAMEERRRNE